jgi:hypothetical protein
MLSSLTPATNPEKNPSHTTMYSSPIPIACVVTSPRNTKAEEYSATPTSAETVTANTARMSPRNAM